MSEKIEVGECVDTVAFSYPEITNFLAENGKVTFVVKQECRVTKSGLRTFEAGGRRHKQGVGGEFQEGSFANSRRAYVKSGTDLEPLYKEARRLIRVRIKREIRKLESAVDGAKQMLSKGDEIFGVDVYERDW